MSAAPPSAPATPPTPWSFRRLLLGLVLAAAAFALFAESVLFRPIGSDLLRHPPALLRSLGPLFSAPWHGYLELRSWAINHPILAILIAVIALAAYIFIDRSLLLVWHNVLLPRISGVRLQVTPEGTFPQATVALMKEIKARPAGSTFVGVTPTGRWPFTRFRPVYLSDRIRQTHCHIMGKTGSGKTQSVIWPMVYQDIVDGKGVIVISGKGSDEEVQIIKALAQAANRVDDLRVFALPAWNRPAIPTHTYNMVHVEPWSPEGPGGDPTVMAERVLNVLPLGGNPYYDQLAKIFFTTLCRILHGVPDPERPGYGAPFNMRDLAVCLKGLDSQTDPGKDNSSSATPHQDLLQSILGATRNQEAVVELKANIRGLGRDVRKSLSGLIAAVDQFQAPMVNAYQPDIIVRDVLQHGRIVYIQLPSNLFKVQAPALGKVFLQDLQQEGSLRQVERTTRSQDPFGVFVDEFATFADLGVISALSQLRDARLQYTLAHQSIADLEIVSPEFATSVWDNTRVKIILNQDNPELCERIAKSIGTRQGIQLTLRVDPGPYGTALQSGVASSRAVEEYKLHPNRIKNLARVGQAYIYSDDIMTPLCLGCFPDVRATYALTLRPAGVSGLNLHARLMKLASASPRSALAVP